MSRRITRSQTIYLAKPPESVLAQNRLKSEAFKKSVNNSTPSTRSTRRSTLNLVNISTPILKDVTNLVEVRSTTRRARKIDSVDNPKEVNTVKAKSTASTSFTSNSKVGSKDEVKAISVRRMSVLVEKLDRTKINSATTSSKVDQITNKHAKGNEIYNGDSSFTSTVAGKALRRKTVSLEIPRAPVGKLDITKKKSATTTSSKVDQITNKQTKVDEIHNRHSSFTSTVVSKVLRRKTVSSEIPRAPVAKSLDIITNESNSTISEADKIQNDGPLSTLNSNGKSGKAVRKSFVFKVPSAPVRRSERVALKQESTLASLKIPSQTQTSKVKDRRRTVHSFHTVNTKNVENVQNCVTVSTKPQINSAVTINPSATKKKQLSTKAAHRSALPTDIVNTSVANLKKTLNTKAARKSVDSNKDKNLKVGTKPQVNGGDNVNTVLANTVNGTVRRVNTNKRAHLEIQIPDELKAVLRVDSNIVNGQNKLYNIPANVTVAKVIDDYVATKHLDNAHSSGTTIQDILHSIIEYFEALIGTQLLYDLEHVQYEDMLQKYSDMAMSEIYPPIYLLRLLIQVNKLLPYSGTDTGYLEWMIIQLNDFVNYLTEHKTVLFDFDSLC